MNPDFPCMIQQLESNEGWKAMKCVFHKGQREGSFLQQRDSHHFQDAHLSHLDLGVIAPVFYAIHVTFTREAQRKRNRLWRSIDYSFITTTGASEPFVLAGKHQHAHRMPHPACSPAPSNFSLDAPEKKIKRNLLCKEPG